MEFTEKLFQALKNDDIKEFKDCMATTNCGPLRLGRFPVLSVMYLYKARRLLHAYEKRFLKHNSWQDVGEPMELSAKFRSVAGKCLRIYLNETVSPVEMLLLLNKDTHVKRVFSQAHVTPPVKQRLTNIYYIKWGLKANFVRNTVVLESRPLTRAEKMQWLLRAVCMLLCLALIASAPFVANAISPFIKDNGVLNVTQWWQIKFDSDNIYSLQKDVTVSEKFFAEVMNCQLVGNGHTVTVTGGSLFGTVNGAISDVTFETNGSPLTEKVALNAQIDNVTVNATVDMQTDKAIGFVAVNNYGDITNTVVNVTGNLSVAATEQDSSESDEVETLMCAGIVVNNNTTWFGGDNYQDANLANCTVNYDDFTVQGNEQVNAAFGGIVGQSVGLVDGCQTNGKISTNTVDVAGICIENNFWVKNCVNNANITQQTDAVEWSPIASGIVMTNYWVVDHCQNNGTVTCVSNAAASTEYTRCAYAAGIVYENISVHSLSYVQFSVNNGNVTASATEIVVAAAGICNASNGAVGVSVNNGKVSANGTKLVEAAGIINEAYYGVVGETINRGAISAIGEAETRVGGIVSYSRATVEECFSDGSIAVSGNICYVGGIVGYSSCTIEYDTPYYGSVLQSIADCKITVTKSSVTDSFAAVGGIVGYAEEKSVSSSVYAGGKIVSCYFTGALQTNADYVGGIAGIVGDNVYNASASEKDVEKKSFHSNMYVDNCGVDKAFGATQRNDNGYQTVDGVGATKSTLSDILSNATYQEILEQLGFTN